MPKKITALRRVVGKRAKKSNPHPPHTLLTSGLLSLRGIDAIIYSFMWAEDFKWFELLGLPPHFGLKFEWDTRLSRTSKQPREMSQKDYENRLNLKTDPISLLQIHSRAIYFCYHAEMGHNDVVRKFREDGLVCNKVAGLLLGIFAAIRPDLLDLAVDCGGDRENEDVHLALICAANAGNESGVRSIVALIGDRWLPDTYQVEVLIQAGASGNLACVKCLDEYIRAHGAVWNQHSQAYQAAAINGHCEVMKYLAPVVDAQFIDQITRVQRFGLLPWVAEKTISDEVRALAQTHLSMRNATEIPWS